MVAGVPLVIAWDVTNEPFAVPKLAVLATGTAAAGGLRAAEAVIGISGRRLRALFLPAALIAVPVVVAWVAADYRSWSLWGAYGRYEGLVPTLLVVAAGVLLADAFAPPSRAVAWTFTAAAAGVALFGAAQSLGLDPLDGVYEEYAPSTIGHSNFFGGFLAIALPVALALWSSTEGRARVAAMAASISIVLGILLAFSQGGWIAAAAGVAVYAGAEMGRRRRGLRIAGWTVAAGLAAAGAGLVLFSFVSPFHPSVPGTARARGLWWREAAAMGAASPVWGHGPDAFAVESVRYRNPEDALAHDRFVADAPHSVPLAYFANRGLLGLAGFVGLLVWAVRRGLEPGRSSLTYGFAAGAAAYFVQSFVSIDMTVLTFSLWVCLAGMGAEALPLEPPPEPVRPTLARLALAAALAVGITGAAAWWSASFVAADARAWSATEAYEDGKAGEALESLAAIAQGRETPFYRHLHGAILGRAALRARFDGADEIERMKEAFEYLDELPDVQGVATYADSLHQWSIFAPEVEVQALEQLHRLLRLDRYSPTARVWTAEALLRLDRPVEAIDVLEPMIPIQERFGRYGTHPKIWGTLAIAYLADDRPLEAARALEDASEAAGELAERDCNVLVARELLRTDGAGAPRDELVRSSPQLMLCRPATLALLPGWDPEEVK